MRENLRGLRENLKHKILSLASLGKSQTAAVIRDADITVAHSNRDAGIQEAECQKVRKSN